MTSCGYTQFPDNTMTWNFPIRFHFSHAEHFHHATWNFKVIAMAPMNYTTKHFLIITQTSRISSLSGTQLALERSKADDLQVKILPSLSTSRSIGFQNPIVLLQQYRRFNIGAVHKQSNSVPQIIYGQFNFNCSRAAAKSAGNMLLIKVLGRSLEPQASSINSVPLFMAVCYILMKLTYEQ